MEGAEGHSLPAQPGFPLHPCAEGPVSTPGFWQAPLVWPAGLAGSRILTERVRGALALALAWKAVPANVRVSVGRLTSACQWRGWEQHTSWSSGSGSHMPPIQPGVGTPQGPKNGRYFKGTHPR